MFAEQTDATGWQKLESLGKSRGLRPSRDREGTVQTVWAVNAAASAEEGAGIFDAEVDQQDDSKPERIA
eukprot:2270147-Pleurochrysis_carterae.AAC.2